MAYVETKSVALNVSARLSAYVAALKLAVAQYGEYRATCREMQNLSNRELDDIGIRRIDIASIARAHVYGA